MPIAHLLAVEGLDIAPKRVQHVRSFRKNMIQGDKKEKLVSSTESGYPSFSLVARCATPL